MAYAVLLVIGERGCTEGEGEGERPRVRMCPFYAPIESVVESFKHRRTLTLKRIGSKRLPSKQLFVRCSSERSLPLFFCARRTICSVHIVCTRQMLLGKVISSSTIFTLTLSISEYGTDDGS